MYRNRMKKLFTMIAAGLLALLSFNSCGIHYNDEFEAASIDAYLTGYYAGGFHSETTQGRYDIEGHYLTDRDIEEIFRDLARMLPETFYEADLEIVYYDWMDNPVDERMFTFWWVMEDFNTGRGFYDWKEIYE